MSSSLTLAGIISVILLISGCSPSVSEVGSEQNEVVSAWVEVAATQFEADGQTAIVEFPAQPSIAALAVRATTNPDICFQLSSVIDGEGRSVVEGRSAGAYCRNCDLRTSVAVGGGVFVLPTEPGEFEPEKGVSLRFGRVDCLTLTPLSKPEDRPTLQLAMLPVETIPEVASIDLRFLISESSILFGDTNRQKEVIGHLEEEFSVVGITPHLIDTHELFDVPTSASFHAGDQTELVEFLANAPAKVETTIDIVFGGCFLYDDPFFGPPSPVNGYTPRIPGGAGPAEAVFMPGLDCFKPGSGPMDIPARTQAHVLAHELGHYLGLYHSVEADGFVDQLDDTDANNIMAPNPQQANAIGFSALQGQVMRKHPMVEGLLLN